MSNETKEPQYKILSEVIEKYGVAELGIMANQSWQEDPKRFLFTLSRYKFVAKMFEGFENILEVGCGDAFAARIVQQHVVKLTVSDFDPVFISDVNRRMNPAWPLKAIVHDFIKDPLVLNFDGAYCLDVFEHIDVEHENEFLANIKSSLKENGVLIVGMPSLESQKYASIASKLGHVNCKTGGQLKLILKNHFENVFLFSMNDEVVHTGFQSMANYLIAICTGKK
jgi:cyclopropane fatty-acyl-phospholipid synthase-like methyltransferase